MNISFKNSFKKSLDTGFIDQKTQSELSYRPKLLVNRHEPKEKVLSTLIQELGFCQEFYISVAFVTTSGVATLMNILLELETKGIKGKVIVSQYLNFTQPEALKRLLRFKNIELKISIKNNSHSKGYIFKTATYYNIIVGSSNWTASALTTNKEWNLKISGLHASEIVNDVIQEFDYDFKDATEVTDSYIAEYEITYNNSRLSNVESFKAYIEETIEPNAMQLEALQNLENLRSENKSKALIISATGTGKTYLSAFDVMAFQPKRILFVVHRLNIAKKALATFSKVFETSKSFGLYSGNSKDLEADFIFSTIQTISREDHLNQFEKNHFDYIIIDESHRSGANSYLKLIKYFRPRFLLGMTATPERTDGNNIFSLFDHNIAYEIRLNRAMEEGMLSQFHYYGITDLQVNSELIENTRDFNLLGTDERVNKIIEKAQLYGTDNGITRGLVFCSRNAEAKLLSQKFNARGLKTVALSGDSSELERSEAILKLETDNINEKIDYIFTVDIFNEGIDIPKINQILMIRPTESAIVFIQQLGRGLRKANGKDYLTIIDFIGNHKNNYMIPIALYGDTSYNKDTLRKLISEGSKMLAGSSTINFDKVTNEKIFQSIDSANMKILSDLKKEYSLLKYRLGRIPMMMDFLANESRDPYLFAEYSKSYYNFVVKADNNFKQLLDKHLINLLQLFSRDINNSKRIEESYILKKIIINGEVTIKSLKDSIKSDYEYNVTDQTITSCVNNLNFKFIRKPENIIIKKENKIVPHKEFVKSLQQGTFRKFLLDSTDYSIKSFNNNYKKECYRDGLILFNKYSRKDVCRLLNWDIDISSTVYGYRTKENITPCFVTYNKSHEIEDSINYNDHFLSPSMFAWESRSNRKVSSNEIQNLISSNRILLFVKKGDGEGTDFYFIGDCSIVTDSIKQAVMPNSQTPIVHFKFKLEQPVSEDLYRYITLNKNKEKTLDDPMVQKDDEPIQIHTIPFYNFYAAAGDFSDMQSEKSYSQIEVPEKYSLSDEYFACKIIGDSMNKRIPSGSICIFKKYSGGSRSGKIFLIENHDIQDPDFNSAFTVKTYSSQKNVTEEGWEHTEILLKPNSYDPSYKDIIINDENSANMKVVGEFVSLIE
jgi:superfamily II DNA or RNA helicase/phage repressor protein C with HTH and peptisase S24 domain